MKMILRSSYMRTSKLTERNRHRKSDATTVTQRPTKRRFHNSHVPFWTPSAPTWAQQAACLSATLRVSVRRPPCFGKAAVWSGVPTWRHRSCRLPTIRLVLPIANANIRHINLDKWHKTLHNISEFLLRITVQGYTNCTVCIRESRKPT